MRNSARSSAMTTRTAACAYDQLMSDETIAARIENLVVEEKELRRREQSDRDDVSALEADSERLKTVEIELDRCWDLLRQRRALRDAGTDPDAAHVRDPDTVEHYLQ
jgi:uncharacterized protein DUF2630